VNDAVALLQELVAIDSTNPDLGPGAGEAELAAAVAGWLSGCGLEVAVEEVEPGRPNVTAVAPGSGGGRSLMLNAHLDTVGVTGYEDPFAALVDGDRCYGRGSLDTKAGLVAAMRATAAAAGMGLAGDVIFTGVIDEEAGSKGTEAVIRGRSADAAIVLEPTGLDVVVAHRGFAWGRVTVHGVAAHGSDPTAGVDAISHAGVVLTGIRELQERLQERNAHPLLGHGSVHAALIAGGQEVSSYPAKCTIDIERRLLPSENVATWKAELTELIGLVAPPATADFEVPFSRFPLQISSDEPIVTELVDAATGVLTDAPRVGGVPYWTDAALLSEAGIPAVVFGPGGGGIHSHEEWVDLPTMDACERTLVRLIERWCRQPTDD
jgi:acetylornithine deacetylase